MSSISANQIIGSYRIVRLLGEGGMGAVYEAIHTTLNRRVAIKVLHPQYAGDPMSAARFLQEAKAANLIQHPAVVQIFEFGQLTDGTAYFIMEFLEGETLSARIRRAAEQPVGRLGAQSLGTCWAIAKVCAVVHRQGLVHRDLKPANIMLVSDPDVPGGERIKLLDFGIVKATHTSGVGGAAADVKTRTGSVMGTPHYMAPEQWRGNKQIDGKADVYALGVIQYQMLTGQLPFDHDDLPVLGMKHCFEEPRPISEFDPSLRPEMAALGMQMLKKEPGQRPSMSEVADALGRILGMMSDAELRPLPMALLDSPVSQGFLPATSYPLVAPAHASTAASSTQQEPKPAVPDLAKPGQNAVISSKPMYAAPPVSQPVAGATSTFLPSKTLRLVFILTTLAVTGGVWTVVQSWRPPPSRMNKDFATVATAEDLATIPDSELPEPDDLAAPKVDDLPASKPDILAASKSHGLESPGVHPHPSSKSSKIAASKQCESVFPTTDCIFGNKLTMDQRALIIDAFRKSAVKLCVGERILLDGLPKAPHVAAVPASLQRDSRAIRALTLTLRGLLGNSAVFPQVEVRCEEP